MSVWHEITPISRTNPFCQETQGQTQQKKRWCLDALIIFRSILTRGSRALKEAFTMIFFTRSCSWRCRSCSWRCRSCSWRCRHISHPKVTMANEPPPPTNHFPICCFVGLTWEAENHNIGQWGNATSHGGNLQNWDCAGAQALYDFLMRWLVHSATHAASRTHLILWAFVSLSAAGESNQHLWV